MESEINMIIQYIWEGIWILSRSLILGAIIYLIILGELYLTNKRRVFKVRQIIYEMLLSIYTVALLKITGIIGMKFYFSYVMNGMYNLSLIPFEEASLMMIFLNFLLFIPYGILLPCVFKNLRFSYKRVVMIGFMTSLSIEVLQLFGGRYAEIDDLLINSLGTFVGFMIYNYVANNILKNEKFIKGCDSSV